MQTVFDSLTFRLSHPEFIPVEYDQARPDAPSDRAVARDALVARTALMVMEPGLSVEGAVTDQQAKPIAGAAVLLASGENLTNRRSLSTDGAGRFRFVVLEPGEAHLVAQAKGYAPQHQLLEIDRGFKPISFALAKGALLKGRVLDGEGKPVTGATVSVAGWNDVSLLNWQTQSDAEGRFSWDSAPEEPVFLQVSKAGFNTTGLPWSSTAAEELTARIDKAFRLTGKVVDAETKEPVKQFRIIRGRSWGGWEEDQMRWELENQTSGFNGTYTLTLDYQQGGDVKFMVSADGYMPAATPQFPESGWHTNDFELKKGSGPKGVVVSPSGEPVEGAQVAICGVGSVVLGKAAFKDFGRERQFMARTDAQGRFSLPAMLASPVIVAVHEQGYAEVSAEALTASGTIALQAWGRIEGVMKHGSRLATNEEVMVTQRSSGPGQLNFDFETFKTRTDEQGRFAFTHVPPGERQLVRLIPRGDRAWMHSHGLRITVKAGETTQVAYGGTGRPVVGKVVLSDPQRKVDWNQGYHSFGTKWPQPPRQFQTQEEWRAWNNSPEMKAARENARNCAFVIAEDGTFRLDDIPAGTYSLGIHLTEPRGDGPGMGQTIGSLTQEVVVPEMPGGRSDEPLDLGELKLQLNQAQRLKRVVER